MRASRTWCSEGCPMTEPRTRAPPDPSAARPTGSRWPLPATRWSWSSARWVWAARAGLVHEPRRRRHRATVSLSRPHRAAPGAGTSGQPGGSDGSAAAALRLAPARSAQPAQRNLGSRVALSVHGALLLEPTAQPPHRGSVATEQRRAGAGARRRSRRRGAGRAAQGTFAAAGRCGGGYRLPSLGRHDARGGGRAPGLLAAEGGLPVGARPAFAGAPGAERMTTSLANRAWDACSSALQFDQYLAGELDPPDAERFRAHVDDCARCTSALNELRSGAKERLPPLRVVPFPPRSRFPIRALAAAAGIAAAASLLLVVRSPGTRSKGTGFTLGMYVEHQGEVRRAGPGETVAPGDAVRFAVSAQVERFAVVVGNDQGQPPDLPLKYAETDAARVASMLQEVGGVRPENLVLLRGQDAGTVRSTLIAVNDRVRAAGDQGMLIVYYSGHGDAGALHPGSSSLELRELEQLVRGSAASFRLLVLDACRSGALTRVKGGSPIPPFDIQLGERVAGEGAVFFTSSSASEDSQESDEIKGSFFTHALVSGLLGAADANGDGRVTLDEAYRYAYETTLRTSSRSVAGIQHPTFEYEVRGMGDFVLATLDANAPTRAWVELPAGRTWLLFQGSQEGSVVGEIGARDRSRRLSLRAGRYFARGRAPDVLLEGSFDAPAGGALAIDESRLERTEYARLVRKGGGGLSAVASLEAEGRLRSSLMDGSGVCPGAAVGMAVALRSVTFKPRVGWCRGGFSNPGLQATVDQYDLELSAVHVRDLHVISVELGLTVGGSLLVQRFQTQGVAPRRTTAALQLSPTVGITRELGARSYLFLIGAASTYLLKSESSATSGSSFGPSFAVRVSIGAGYRL